MDELLKSLRQFIARDLVFVVGGGSVILTFLHRFDRLPSINLPIPWFLLSVGMAWVVGYGLHDAASLIRLVGTDAPHEAWKPTRALFWLFTRQKWEDIDTSLDLDGAPERIKDQRQNGEYERIITLLMAAATMAPAGLVAASFLAWRWSARGDQFDLALSVAAGLLGFLFIGLARLKRAQLGLFLSRHAERIQKKG